MTIKKNAFFRKVLTALVFIIAAYLFMRVWSEDNIMRMTQKEGMPVESRVVEERVPE